MTINLSNDRDERLQIHCSNMNIIYHKDAHDDNEPSSMKQWNEIMYHSQSKCLQSTKWQNVNSENVVIPSAL